MDEADDALSQIDEFERRIKRLAFEESEETGAPLESGSVSSHSASSDEDLNLAEDRCSPSSSSTSEGTQSHTADEFMNLEVVDEEEEGSETTLDEESKNELKDKEMETLQAKIEELQQLLENQQVAGKQSSNMEGFWDTQENTLERTRPSSVSFADLPRRAKTAATSSGKNYENMGVDGKEGAAANHRPSTRSGKSSLTANDVIIKVIKANLKHLAPGRIPVVLVSTGTYNPIHMQHLRMFYTAREYLMSKKEYQVVGGIISPSHDHAVRHKLRSLPSQIIPARHRVAMAEVAVEGSSWLTIDRWEISRKSSLEYPSVLRHVETMLQKVFGREKMPSVMYLCGADHLVRCGPQTLQHFGCVCFSRPGYTEELERIVSKRYQKLVHIIDDDKVVPAPIASLSCTKIRRRLISGNDVKPLVGNSVAEYIAEHEIGDKVAKRKPWEDCDRHKIIYLTPAYRKVGNRFERIIPETQHQ